MQEIILAVIKDMSPWTGFMFGSVVACCTIIIVSYMTVKPNKLSHAENMARIETQHREVMTKISRDVPRLANGLPANVIENQRQPERQPDREG